MLRRLTHSSQYPSVDVLMGEPSGAFDPAQLKAAEETHIRGLGRWSLPAGRTGGNL
jgi:hypothetical protein